MYSKTINLTSALFGAKTSKRVSNSENTSKEHLTNAKKDTVVFLTPAVEAVKYCYLSHVENGMYFGTLTVNDEQYCWKSDTRTVWTDAPEQQDDKVANSFALMPVVTIYEEDNSEMLAYRNAFLHGKDDENLAYKYCDAFFYGYLTARPKEYAIISVIFGCDTKTVIPETPIKTEKRTVTVKNSFPGETALPWKKDSLKDIPNDLSVESARAGKYRMNLSYGTVDDEGTYDFAQDILPLDFLDGYVDNPTFRTVLKSVVEAVNGLYRANGLEETEEPVNKALADAAIASITRNILLVGDPGSGKTMLLRAVACALGLPIAICRLNEHSEADALTEEIKVTDKGFVSQKARLYYYVKYGGIFVFDDMTNAETNIFFATVGGLLESPYVLQVGMKDVKRHPLCFLTATANIGTEGSKNVNEALLSRFGLTELCERIDEDAFKKCIRQRAGIETGIILPAATEKVLADWVYGVYESTISGVKQFSADIADKLVTMRSAISLLERLEMNLVDGFPLDATKEAVRAFANPLYAAGENEAREVIAKSILALSTKTIEFLQIEE